MCDLCRAEGNRIGSKFRSVESFRSNHKPPEVLTFDELVERSPWSVELAERQEESEAEFPDFRSPERSCSRQKFTSVV